MLKEHVTFSTARIVMSCQVAHLNFRKPTFWLSNKIKSNFPLSATHAFLCGVSAAPCTKEIKKEYVIYIIWFLDSQFHEKLQRSFCFYEKAVNMVYKTERIADTVLRENLTDVHEDKASIVVIKDEILFQL